MIEGKASELPIRMVVRPKDAATAYVSADICVVGSGISGTSAAIEAARLGRSVILVDGQPALGGQAVNSIIGSICGLFSSAPSRRQLTHGIADDIIRDLGSHGMAHLVDGPHTTTVYYDEVALGRWVEKQVLALGIQVVLGAVLRSAKLENRRITELSLATRYGDVSITAKGFVDASGDAALTWLAGLPCRLPDVPIYGTQVVVLENADEQHKPTPEDCQRRLQEKAGDYGLIRQDGFTLFFPKRGTVVINMNHVKTPLDPLGASRKALEGKEEADRMVVFLQREFPAAFGKATVRAYGLPGIRQTRWIVGRRQLTADDVRTATHFEDAVARTAWPIELHSLPEGFIWETFSPDHVHYVPLRSMTPADADNVVAAGRCIDGDAAALSSVRVMGPGIAMGAAAAHALDLADGGSVHEIDLGALRRRLIRNLEG